MELVVKVLQYFSEDVRRSRKLSRTSEEVAGAARLGEIALICCAPLLSHLDVTRMISL